MNLKMNNLRYGSTALGMGIVWYVAMLPFGSAVPLAGEIWYVHLLAMCFASLTVAVFFYGPIVRVTGWKYHVLAIALPSVGAFIFGVYTVIGWYLHALTIPGRGVDVQGSAMIPIMFVIFGAWGLCFITVPLGYLSQWVMRNVGTLDRPHRPAPVTRSPSVRG